MKHESIMKNVWKLYYKQCNFKLIYEYYYSKQLSNDTLVYNPIHKMYVIK